MRSQLSAQRRQASTHSCISPTSSQLAAQARQISAQARQVIAIEQQHGRPCALLHQGGADARAERVKEELGVNAAQVYLAKHRVGRILKKEIARLSAEGKNSPCVSP